MAKHAPAVQSHAMHRFATIPGLTHSDSEPQERHCGQVIPFFSFRQAFGLMMSPARDELADGQRAIRRVGACIVNGRKRRPDRRRDLRVICQ